MQGLWSYKKGLRLITGSIKYQPVAAGETRRLCQEKLHYILLTTLSDEIYATDDITSQVIHFRSVAYIDRYRCSGCRLWLFLGNLFSKVLF